VANASVDGLFLKIDDLDLLHTREGVISGGKRYTKLHSTGRNDSVR